MADWKDALSALAGMQSEEETENIAESPKEKGTSLRAKSRTNGDSKGQVVYSTNPDYEYTEEEVVEIETVPKNQQKLRLSMERAGRNGKTVSIVHGFVGSEADLQALGKLLKQKCGVGGTVKDGDIIIQGDHRSRLIEFLKNEGYTQTK